MSVSLMIRWADGTGEEVPLGTQAAIERGWQPIARGLGLKYVPLFSSFIPVDVDNIDAILSELPRLRADMISQPTDYSFEVSHVDELISALHRLRSAKGWNASIG